jgi:multidrug resistance efflux pump
MNTDTLALEELTAALAAKTAELDDALRLIRRLQRDYEHTAAQLSVAEEDLTNANNRNLVTSERLRVAHSLLLDVHHAGASTWLAMQTARANIAAYFTEHVPSD